MSVHNHARDLVEWCATDFDAIFRYFEKTAVARQMPTIGGYINNLVQYDTQSEKQ